MRAMSLARCWSIRVALFAAAACAPLWSPLAAQRGPLGAAPGSPAARADSVARRGDTTAALALLDSAVRANKRDASSWYLAGLLQWEMARGDRRAMFMKDQRAVRLLHGADTSLRLATQFAPDSARYWLALSKYNLQSGVSTVRFASQGQVGHALDAAVKTGDSLLIAVAADEVGMANWRRYETSANRGLVKDNQRIQLTSANNWDRTKARDYVDQIAAKIEPPTGRADYEAALVRFEQAVAADSSNLRFSRHLFMALGETKRWGELAAVATQRATQFPLDYQAQLARGLALHRLERPKEAKVAFDSALALMDDEERERLTRFTRILRPTPTKESKATGGDSVAYSSLPAAQRRGLEEMYWYMNDPLTLTAENEYRLEFLSRVVFADFRWTDEDLGYRGADTDRGDIYVRYGPPDFEMTVAGDVATSTVNLIWSYNIGLTFFFDMSPGFGTARSSFADRNNQQNIVNSIPVSWANMPTTRMIDTIPMRVVRFRARGDSTDAVVAARVPLDSLTRGLNLTPVPVDFDFRVFDQFVRVQGVESSQSSVAADSASGVAQRVWTRRLGPGINVVRVEAMQADSRRAARAMAQLRPMATSGFGMSDVLLGSKPAPRTADAPSRWRDVDIIPGEGSFASGASIGLLWELYELSEKDNQSKYKVTITVERAERGGIAGLGVRLLDGVGRAVGRAQQSRDRINISFDRTAAPAATLVEYLSLDMATAPAGRYRLRVEIQDLGTKERTLRDTEFLIR